MAECLVEQGADLDAAELFVRCMALQCQLTAHRRSFAPDGKCDPTQNGLTAMIQAVINGQTAIVKYLVEKGADVNKNSVSDQP